MMEVYLDNSATTKITDNVKDKVIKLYTKISEILPLIHRYGIKAEQYIKDATEIIAKAMKVEPKEIVFTSGGTEANNLALIGTAMANRRRKPYYYYRDRTSFGT